MTWGPAKFLPMTTHYYLKISETAAETKLHNLLWNERKCKRLESYQYSKNTIISFTTQYKNDNIAFHRISAVSGSLAFLRAFCQWRLNIK